MWVNVLRHIDDEGTRVPKCTPGPGTTSDSLAGAARVDRDVAPPLEPPVPSIACAPSVDVERDASVALPLSAHVVRVLGRKPRRVTQLPVLSGVSKEAHAMSLGSLGRVSCVVVETDPTTGRGPVAALTPKGARAAAQVRRAVAATESSGRTTTCEPR